MGRLREPIDTHRVVFRTAIPRYNLGTVPLALHGNDPWYPPDIRERVNQRIDEELAALGVLQGRDLRPDFEDALFTQGRPEFALEAWIEFASGAMYKVHLAAAGSDATLLQVLGDDASMKAIEPRRLAGELLDKMPLHPDGHGNSYTFPEAEAPWNCPNGLLPNGNRAGLDARKAARFTEGNFNVVTKVSAVSGDRRIGPLSIFDSEDYGRWALVTDGEYVTLMPATEALLVGQVEKLLEQVKR